MTGTQNHEGLAGVAAAVDYLAEIGAAHPDLPADPPSLSGRRLQLRRAMAAIQAYEGELGKRLLAGLVQRPRFKVSGITAPDRLAWRVPTVSVTLPGRTPADMAAHLAARQIYVWDGNLYALSLSERLGLEPHGGFLRLGLVHYNTGAEIDRLLAALDEL
jgi:selenocysteine lyase/cysteine desulfurase